MNFNWLEPAIGVLSLVLLWQQNRILREANRVPQARARQPRTPQASIGRQLQLHWPLAAMGALVFAVWLPRMLALPFASAIPQPAQVPTGIRLQFNGEHTMPYALDQENIFRWYALFTGVIHADSPERKVERLTWTLFLTFDKPVAVQQVRLDSERGKLPEYEVKDFTSRGAVIVLSGDLVGLVVHVRIVS